MSEPSSGTNKTQRNALKMIQDGGKGKEELKLTYSIFTGKIPRQIPAG
jgi:hypothetical protein